MGYIYKITNTINKKAYIGVTTKDNPNERWSNHKSAIRANIGCPFLQKAVKKYGEESFKFEVLIICFDDDVFKFENEYILKNNTMSPNGYNIATGGIKGPSFLGKHHSEETKHILSKKSREYHNRPEIKEQHRQRAFEINIGELLKNLKNGRKLYVKVELEVIAIQKKQKRRSVKVLKNTTRNKKKLQIIK